MKDFMIKVKGKGQYSGNNVESEVSEFVLGDPVLITQELGNLMKQVTDEAIAQKDIGLIGFITYTLHDAMEHLDESLEEQIEELMGELLNEGKSSKQV